MMPISIIYERAAAGWSKNKLIAGNVQKAPSSSPTSSVKTQPRLPAELVAVPTIGRGFGKPVCLCQKETEKSPA